MTTLQIFVDHSDEPAAKGNAVVSGTKGCGFKQMDVVHLFGLVCPDFPEDLVSRVRAFSRLRGGLRTTEIFRARTRKRACALQMLLP